MTKNAECTILFSKNQGNGCVSLSWVENALAEMTIEEKVGQTFMVAYFVCDDDVIDGIKKDMDTYHLGGIFHFVGQHNAIADYINQIQNHAKIPLLIGADYEIGTGWTVDDGFRFPRPMARGAAGRPELEYEIGKQTAQQGRSIGATVTFSPVIDLNTNHLNPDVNVRAYGEDIGTVTEFALPYIKGLQENGMLATVKHFPGNGSTDMDQHICPAVISLTREELNQTCLSVYKKTFEAGAAAVMVAHLEVPALTTELNPVTGRPVPASLSKEVITDLLKGEMGFDGLVISDALNMGGVTSQYTRGDIAVKAIQAGIDMLLAFNPDDFFVEYNAVLAAAKSGEISMDRLDDAVRSVLKAKTKLSLHETKGLAYPEELRDEYYGSPLSAQVSREITDSAVTVLKNKDGLLPLSDIDGKKVMVINTFNPDGDTYRKQHQTPMKEILSEGLKNKGAIVDTFEAHNDLSLNEMRAIVGKVREYDYVFFNFFIVPTWGIGSMIPNKNAVRILMYGALSPDVPVIVTCIGDPYVMYYCPTAKTILFTFDESVSSQESVLKAWFGEIPTVGKMPVSLKDYYKKGDGIQI